jgi:DNA-binding MarR family transcriptional regulator
MAPPLDLDRAIDEVATQCLLYRSRMTARAVTRLYTEGFRAAGLSNAAQFSLLVAIRRGQWSSLVELADRLGLERSTLVRNIQTLENEGLVASHSDGPGIAKRLTVTARGESLLAAAYPVWRDMQQRLAAELHEPDFHEIRRALRGLGKAAMRLQDGD